jgi:hypothetical protein
MARLASALAVAAFVLVAARTAVLAVPFMNPDNLAYLAWGEELRAGGLPTAENALTTPHPVPILLMAVVGGIVSPLATWAALAVAGLAAVVAGAALVAWRAAGAPGVAGALLALALAGGIWSAGPLRGIDWLAAGAIGLALAVPPEHRRVRLVLLVLAGLVRPEAWLLPPLLALAGDRRSIRAAVSWGVAAPGLWVLFDGALLDDPLLAFHRTDALAGIAAPGPGLAGLVGLVISAAGVGLFVAWLGAARLWESDVLPGLVLAAVPIALVAELAVGYPVRERYALLLVPAVAGAAGSLARFGGRLQIVVPLVLVAAALVIAASRDVAGRRLPLTRERAEAAAIDAHLPSCARIGVSGLGVRTPGLLPPLAVLTGRPLHRFVSEPAPGSVDAVLAPSNRDGLPVLAQGDGWVLAGRAPSCAQVSGSEPPRTAPRAAPGRRRPAPMS